MCVDRHGLVTSACGTSLTFVFYQMSAPRRSSRGADQRDYALNRRIACRPLRSDLERLVMIAIAYLAGPDVFLPDAVAHAATKVEICR